MGYDFYWEEPPEDVRTAYEALDASYEQSDHAITERCAKRWSDAQRKAGNHWGSSYSWFSHIHSVMERTGMYFTVPDQYRSPWPDSPANYDERSDEYLAYEAACELCRTEGFEHPGIPRHKISGSDGYLVLPDEIRSALKQLSRYTEKNGRPAFCGGADASGVSWWDRWIEYMGRAAEHGGFRVR